MVGEIGDIFSEGGIVQLFADVGDPGVGGFLGCNVGLLLFSGQDSLLVNGCLSLLLAFSLMGLSHVADDGVVGIQPVLEFVVDEGVLLLSLDVVVVFGGSDDALDFV